MRLISPITTAYTMRYFRARVDTLSEGPTLPCSISVDRSFVLAFHDNFLSSP